MDSSLTIVLAVVAAYFAISLGLGFWVARRERNLADDYFLAGRKLPWYAISLSMTGSNIGTEHFIGMVGTAYVFGMAPATYEWGNFIPYSVLLWIFLPFFFRKKLFTIPEFLERRYNATTRTTFAWLTMFHMVLGVLVPALYAGGRILYEMSLGKEITDLNWPFFGYVAIISGVTAAYCIYGGLLSVVWTDVLQVAILVLGGLTLVLIGLHEAGGIAAVVEANKQAGPERLSLILGADHPISPWTGVATFWFTLSLWYVGTNQFYIQRCLGARSEWDAKMGVIGCGMLKVFLPLIIVFPGMIAFAQFGPDTLRADHVYVEMVNRFLSADGVLGPLGPYAQGLLLAALVAAIMSTVSSVLNSTSTIWSMDVYQRMINSAASEGELVRVGRWATLITIVVGTALAPLLLYWGEGIFVFIQDIAALMAPPIAVVFLAAFLWRRAHGRAATVTLVFGIVAGALLWLGTSLLWIAPSVDFADLLVQQRLAETEDKVLKQHLAEDTELAARRAAILDLLAADTAVQDRLADVPEVRERLVAIMQSLTTDPGMRQQIAENADVRRQLAAEPEVRERLAADAGFREYLAGAAELSRRLFSEQSVQEHLAEDADVLKRLLADAAVANHLAEQRLAGWLPPLGEESVSTTVAVIGRMKPLLNRAAITWGLCVVVMIGATLFLRQDPGERYDPDAIWNLRWARLPQHERVLNAGPRNLLLWWLVMVAASGSLFAIFR